MTALPPRGLSSPQLSALTSACSCESAMGLDMVLLLLVCCAACSARGEEGWLLNYRETDEASSYIMRVGAGATLTQHAQARAASLCPSSGPMPQRRTSLPQKRPILP